MKNLIVISLALASNLCFAIGIQDLSDHNYPNARIHREAIYSLDFGHQLYGQIVHLGDINPFSPCTGTVLSKRLIITGPSCNDSDAAFLPYDFRAGARILLSVVNPENQNAIENFFYPRSISNYDVEHLVNSNVDNVEINQVRRKIIFRDGIGRPSFTLWIMDRDLRLSSPPPRVEAFNKLLRRIQTSANDYTYCGVAVMGVGQPYRAFDGNWDNMGLVNCFDFHESGAMHFQLGLGDRLMTIELPVSTEVFTGDDGGPFLIKEPGNVPPILMGVITKGRHLKERFGEGYFLLTGITLFDEEDAHSINKCVNNINDCNPPRQLTN